ncbi:hypothetical protein [uncultured Thiohalocapsa sp.]|uniref:hypothetical protein n=1 Tax=uncultured Thiohalocapsa sp. TaxID=768990 RepID=UPI0025D6DDC4|nr:hypothetical protein [uncultured Thiohalocapsa sp.]
MLMLLAAAVAPQTQAADAASAAPTLTPTQAPVAPTEPAACGTPFSAAATTAAPQELLQLAARCRDPAVAALLQHRAEHAEQLRQLELMSRLIRHGGNNDRVRLTQCRLYTGLAESFAARMHREDPAALADLLAQLNLAYEQAIHIAERAIAGRERIVGLPTAPP